MADETPNAPSAQAPEAGVGDAAHAVVKAGLSVIPVLGGPVAELFEAVIAPPLNKRRDAWMESIAEGLQRLEERVSGFSMERLADDDLFITTVMQASQSAIRNHQREKLDALRNAVLNTALMPAPDETIHLMLVSLIDQFTPWHLRLLAFFDDPSAWGKTHGITFPNRTMGGAATVLEDAMPELKDRRDFYDQLVADLASRGVMSGGSLHATVTSQGMFASRTTELGKRLLALVSPPPAIG